MKETLYIIRAAWEAIAGLAAGLGSPLCRKAVLQNEPKLLLACYGESGFGWQNDSKMLGALRKNGRNVQRVDCIGFASG